MTKRGKATWCVCTGVKDCRQVLFWDAPLKHGTSVLGSTVYFPEVASAGKRSQVRSSSSIGSLLGSHLRANVVQKKCLHLSSDPRESMSPRGNYLPNTKR